jgi:hypothetical protein
MSLFDPNTFLDSDAGGPLSTERVLVPINTYHPCFITDIKPVEGLVKEGDNAGKPWARLDFIWTIDSQELRDLLNRAQVKVTQGIMLDLTEDGQLDTGKGRNVQLGKLRKALGINNGPVQYREFLGKPATLQIGHEATNTGGVREKVVAVAGL